MRYVSTSALRRGSLASVLVVGSALVGGCDTEQAAKSASGTPKGPIDCTFTAFTPNGSTVTWTIEPGDNRAAASIQAAPYCTAGFSCNFGKEPTTVDLSG